VTYGILCGTPTSGYEMPFDRQLGRRNCIMMSVQSRPFNEGQLVWLFWPRPPVRQKFRKLQRLWTGPWRIQSFKSPLVVVLKHTVKRTRQTVHVDPLLPCNTPPPAEPEVDSGIPPDYQTPTDGQDIPDGDSQPSLGWKRTVSPGGHSVPSSVCFGFGATCSYATASNSVGAVYIGLESLY